ncbi:PR domain zinc finger protein 8-like [Cyprinus carpio]|uniref:PR domain zinc finger protein 8-like n=2 Tax=Cyprinus carpio TaxID=7962 RepID=A0A9Q9YST6_CYPCA|nr:PR domain zinc finger protein 8-like [Cyprinus carpio]XP_042625076.1 PR domain zinc finger protein 8-like [Cyprinus carpio]
MEQSIFPRSLWTNDSKFLHHHVADFFTSVQVTQDIPAGTSFGPCVLHNTFYDTIAFIALKSSDKRNKSHAFRVDPEAMKGSPLVVPWLRLVQAAMSTEDQNTEAYLKGGQLHFQTIRDVKQGEELLVWYDEELSHLLGFEDIKTKALTDGYTCSRCGQAFKNENPFLAHCRFLCAQEKVHIIRPSNEQKQEVKRQRKIIDFHNIARDLEHKKNGSPEDMGIPRKRKQQGSLSPRSKKTALLEKTNITNYSNTANVNTDGPPFQDLSESDNLSTNESNRSKSSAFTEVRKPSGQPNPEQTSRDVMASEVGLKSDCSAFSFVVPKSAHSEQKSAFCEPNKRTITEVQNTSPPFSDNISDSFKSKTTLGYRNILASHLFHADLPSAHAGGVTSAPLATGGSFYYAPEHWTRAIGGQLQSTSLTLLPPTFTPLGVSVQNWCAKCNLSFRMTSDLVFHMRSHHKKEFAAEAQVRRRREEKLTCPICHEYFRERHHLSRHMTSHN